MGEEDNSASKPRRTSPVRSLSRPARALRLVFRFPIYLYQLRLGWLLGHRGLLLTHRGRKSGRAYRTVLEVVRYDLATQESVVLSGWGEKADWYRNIRASPALEIRTARERYVPEQRFLDPEENHAVVCEYAQRHPLAFRLLAQVFGYPTSGTEAARREFAKSLRLVAFRPPNEL